MNGERVVNKLLHILSWEWVVWEPGWADGGMDDGGEGASQSTPVRQQELSNGHK